ncbi:DEAD/DEAH box helicase family protein [Geodermatophilus sp. SYSU D00708]
MAVEIKFEANQQYQLDAINSVVDIFAGQEGLSQGFTTTTDFGGSNGGALFEEVVFGNSLALQDSTLEINLRRVQDRPVLQEDGSDVPAIAEDLRTELAAGYGALDFSVEMETGTGKTYVYLRTIAELNRKYGYTKFVIVVPSIAIREGVLSSLRLLKEHIRELYDGLQFDSYVWDSRFPTRVHQFATASHLQIMVINIDSFTKETNIINKVDPDRLNGYAPIEYLRACHPIVIMDEPQNMETPVRQEAIRSLSPLFRLRYSATHRDLKHLVYRLTPVDAYDLRLVKRIGVLSITKDEDLNDAHVEVTKINATPGNVTATAKIHKTSRQGTKLTQVTLRKDMDLYEASGQRSIYQGWMIEDIHTGQDGRPGHVEFSNGRRVREGIGTGSETEQHQRLMIRQAVESHFEKELQLKLQQRRGIVPAAIKPLTLFFIDKVANYAPEEGKFRQWFEQEYEFIRSDARFRSLTMPDVEDVHDGYFATTPKGVPKDITFGRDTKDAEGAFERIMQNKEKLLSFEEPLRFIFSHSALVEGWDNPNVFTICNLQDGRSEMRKRQQIGRGLRLPVMDNGERCRVDDINMVTVIAYEEFSKFAGDLQKEIEEETGVSFAGRISDLKKDKIKLKLKEQVLNDPLFQQLWDKISRKTTYQLEFETDDVVAEAVERINAMEKLEPIKFRISKTEVEIKVDGVGAGDSRDRGTVEVEGARKLPDVVGELSRRVPLSRATIVRILTKIDNLDQVKLNPAVFIDNVEAAINQALYKEVAKGIVYTPTGNERWSAELFKTAHQDETVAKAEFVVPVSKSLTEQVVCDSKVEVAFAQYLEQRDDVPFFLKLPRWFKIDTPLGNYNPDWAFIRKGTGGQYFYLVRETKGTDVIEDLQWETEGWKIKFGEAHFNALKVDYFFHKDPKVLIEVSPDYTAHGGV